MIEWHKTSKDSNYLELIVQVEQKFKNELLEYLRHCKYICPVFIFSLKFAKLDYMINKFATPLELKAIANQWNIDDFDFDLALHVRRISNLVKFPSLIYF